MNLVEKMRAEWFWCDKWAGSSAFLLPLNARGLYREMLTQAWWRAIKSEGEIRLPCLPADHEAIRRACGCTEKEWKKAWPLVERYWKPDGAGNLVNETQLLVYADALCRAQQTSDRARHAAETRWSDAQAYARAHARGDARARPRACARAMPSGSVTDNNPPTPPLRGRRRRPGPDLPEQPQAPPAETAPGRGGRSVVAELRARGQQPSGAWTRILGHLELKLNPHSFATWMRPTEELGVLTDGEGDRLVIVVPNDTFRTWITRNYREAIDEACQAAGVTAGLTFVTRDEVEAG